MFPKLCLFKENHREKGAMQYLHILDIIGIGLDCNSAFEINILVFDAKVSSKDSKWAGTATKTVPVFVVNQIHICHQISRWQPTHVCVSICTYVLICSIFTGVWMICLSKSSGKMQLRRRWPCLTPLQLLQQQAKNKSLGIASRWPRCPRCCVVTFRYKSSLAVNKLMM